MFEKINRFIAAGFGLGFIPVAPGTFGTLLGVAIFYVLRSPQSTYLITSMMFIKVTVGITLVSFVIAHLAEKSFKQKDAQQIVIDEVAGVLCTYAFVSFSVFNLVLGFLLFRLFDIAKIFPANLAQDKLKGGLGVVGDDVVAGLQAGVILYYLPWIIEKVKVFL
jgi:phosphatidylglycerophosphatase A